jgi:pyrroloquinoline quinone (PQQ) biosynthesis protein C
VIELLYTRQTDELTSSDQFRALEEGRLSQEGYDQFVANVIRTHRHSPQLLAFLFALAPPDARERVKRNLLEEMGIEDKAAHPVLLVRLAEGVGLAPALGELDRLSQEMLRAAAGQRLQFGTLKEVGFAIMVEVFAFEYMLAKTADRIAEALARYRGIEATALEWFTHHGVMDKRHAEEAFATVDDYVTYYGIPTVEVLTIAEMTLRMNLFTTRYFGELPLARLKAMSGY